MTMESPTTSSHSVVSEFEGTILKNEDSFSYFMLVAYEASGPIRFTILMFLWPIIALLDVFGYKNAALKLMIFVATSGVRESEIKLVARAVLPKFYMDDLSMDTWRVFNSSKKKVVVTRMPRVMVEMFAKEHLRADEVIGTELIVNGFGFVTGLIRETDIDQSVLSRVGNLFVDRRPHLGIGRSAKMISTTFLSLCQEQAHTPVHWNNRDKQPQLQPPKPVIFHDGRFVKRPTPATALLILIWFPFGIILAAIRMFIIFVLPLWAIPYVIGISLIRVTIKGKPPQPLATRNSDLLFVGNHKTVIDGIMLSYALGRKIPSMTFWPLSASSYFLDILSVSWLQNILFPIPLVWILRIRDIDAKNIKQVLSKGDVLIFPEGAYFSEPFLLRFSALFAELTDKIVPVAMNGGTCLTVDGTAGFFRATGRAWIWLNYIFFFMNPTLVYEVTFLDQLPLEETCSSGKSPYDVANHVQKILADTLGFECTNYTRKDKYKLLT